MCWTAGCQCTGCNIWTEDTPGALSSVFVSGLGAALALGFGFSSFLPSLAAAFAFALALALGSGLAAFEGFDSFAGAAAFDFFDFAGLQVSQ